MASCVSVGISVDASTDVSTDRVWIVYLIDSTDRLIDRFVGPTDVSTDRAKIVSDWFCESVDWSVGHPTDRPTDACQFEIQIQNRFLLFA